MSLWTADVNVSAQQLDSSWLQILSEGSGFHSQLILFYNTVGIKGIHEASPATSSSVKLTEYVSVLMFVSYFFPAFGCSSATPVFGQQHSGGSLFGQVSTTDFLFVLV